MLISECNHRVDEIFMECSRNKECKFMIITNHLNYVVDKLFELINQNTEILKSNKMYKHSFYVEFLNGSSITVCLPDKDINIRGNRSKIYEII